MRKEGTTIFIRLIAVDPVNESVKKDAVFVRLRQELFPILVIWFAFTS